PSPEFFPPPHEHWQAPWLKEWSLIQTIPDSSTRAMRSPRARSRVQTEAPSPNSESLARLIASCSESTTTIGRTGPKIPPRVPPPPGGRREGGGGGINLRGGRGPPAGPPKSFVAPAATASSI